MIARVPLGRGGPSSARQTLVRVACDQGLIAMRISRSKGQTKHSTCVLMLAISGSNFGPIRMCAEATRLGTQRFGIWSHAPFCPARGRWRQRGSKSGESSFTTLHSFNPMIIIARVTRNHHILPLLMVQPSPKGYQFHTTDVRNLWSCR